MFKSLFLFVMLAITSFFASADANYPFLTPTYIPNADALPSTYTAPADYNLTLLGVGTTTLRVSGTCTSLAAIAQGSNDQGSNWTAINLYPIATGTTAPTSVASISAVGFWKINTVGFNLVRLHITALTATCVVEMLGSPGGFNGTQF